MVVYLQQLPFQNTSLLHTSSVPVPPYREPTTITTHTHSLPTTYIIIIIDNLKNKNRHDLYSRFPPPAPQPTNFGIYYIYIH